MLQSENNDLQLRSGEVVASEHSKISIDPADYPGILSDIADVAGYQAAAKVAREYGGECKRFPAMDTIRNRNNWLVKCLGFETAKILVDELMPETGAFHIDIPKGPYSLQSQRRAKRLKILDLLARGLSTNQIARSVGCTRRTVFNHKRALVEQGSRS